MGFWSGIKYALNSTLGTKDFKPLNEIIRDEILNGSGLVSSDNLYYPSIIEENIDIGRQTSYNKTFDVKLKFNVLGTVKLQATYSSTQVNRLDFTILKNNNIFQSFSVKSNQTSTRDVILEFSKDDVFTFTISGDGYSESSSAAITASIYADVIDYSGITITNNI